VQIAKPGVIRLGGVLHPLHLEHASHVGDKVALLALQSIADHGGNVIDTQIGAAPADSV